MSVFDNQNRNACSSGTCSAKVKNQGFIIYLSIKTLILIFPSPKKAVYNWIYLNLFLSSTLIPTLVLKDAKCMFLTPK